MDVVVSFHSDFTQKCHIPSWALSSLNGKMGSYVIIRCKSLVTLNKVYAQAAPVKFFEADDTVVLRGTCYDISYCTTSYPVDLEFHSQTVLLQKITVKIVLRDVESLIDWCNNDKLKKYAKLVLRHYGVVKGCIVKCSRNPIGEICGVHRVDILDIHEKENVVGQVTESTVIDVIDVTSKERLEQQNSLVHVVLGGLDNVISRLKVIFELRVNRYESYYSKVLLTGPSGCGKSTLVKKLASSKKSHLYTVHMHELARMNCNECSNLCDTIVKMGKLPSEFQFIFFFKNIDYSFSNSKEKTKALFLLLSFLDLASQCRNIAVFGSAAKSQYLHPSLRKPGRFTNEVYIGVPTMQQREHILEVLTADLRTAADLSKIARWSPGYVGSDLSLLCMEAERNACGRLISHSGIEQMKNEEEPVVATVDFEDALNVVKPSILKDSAFRVVVQPTCWEDIGGMQAIKKRVKLCIEWPLLHPEAFSRVGLPCPHGVLLFGPPGCCKTTLVRVIATECKATFLSASPAQIYSPFVGDSEKAVVELFHQARLCAPSIIFLDEIESLVGRRSYGSKHRGIQEKVLSSLLNEMDGFGIQKDSLQGVETEKLLENDCINDQNLQVQLDSRSNQNVIVVAATNRIDLIDDALLRPGRFDAVIYVPPPKESEREAILKTLTRKMMPQDVNMKWLAQQTELFSGADLKNLCRMAAISAIKNSSQVTKEHFVSALKLAHPTLTKKQIQDYQQMASRYGPLIAG